MSLAERLEAEKPVYKPTFNEWLISLSPEDRQALEDAGRNAAWTNAALSRIIREEGGPAGKDAISRWRSTLVAR